MSKSIAHTDHLFRQAASPKISDMICINVLEFYCKHQHRKLPNYFCNFKLTTQGSHHSYNTRSSEQNKTNNRIRLFLPKVINSTLANMLQKIATHSLQGFSTHIKSYHLDEYTEISSVANCYICQRT